MKPFGQRVRRHKFLTAELRKRLPALYSQEDVADPLVVVKFFSPYSGAYWLITEFDGKDRMFGWAELMPGMGELGYVSLKEIEGAVGGTGLLRGLPLVERDLYFDPVPLSEAKAKEQKSRGWKNRKAGRRNAVTQLEGKTDALRRGMARTDLAWNPSLKRQLKQLLSRGEKMLSQLHHADLQHRLYGPSRGLQIPTTTAMDKLLTELSYAGLLFQPTGRTNRRGQRIVEEPKSPQEALILALMMAIEAPSEAQSKEAVAIALTIMDRFGLSERDLERARASADMLIAVRSLQVEGKSVEDLMREGTLLTTPFGGPVGQANRNVDDVVIWLWTLAENPQEIARLLKATPKKTQKAANALHDEIRRRHHGQVGVPDDEVGRTSSGAEQRISLQGLIYLNLFSSQIAPDAGESAFLFLRAAGVLSRAFEQKLPFTKKDLSRVIQQSMDSVRASMAMKDMIPMGPVGEANRTRRGRRSAGSAVGLYAWTVDRINKTVARLQDGPNGVDPNDWTFVVTGWPMAQNGIQIGVVVADAPPGTGPKRLGYQDPWPGYPTGFPDFDQARQYVRELNASRGISQGRSKEIVDSQLYGAEAQRRWRKKRGRRATDPYLHPATRRRGRGGPLSCRWIPVSRPPSEPGTYLVWDSSPGIDPSDRAWPQVFSLGDWWGEHGPADYDEVAPRPRNITHWTRLPGEPERTSSPKSRAKRGSRNTVTLIPAYGRDYKTKKAVLADWKAGKDFIIYSYGHRYDGKYINKEDADRGGETVSIRYAGRTKQLIIRPG